MYKRYLETERNKNELSQGRPAFGQLQECVRGSSPNNSYVEAQWGQKKVDLPWQRTGCEVFGTEWNNEALLVP